MTRPLNQRSPLQRRVELLGTCAMVALTIGLVQSREAEAAPPVPALQGTPTVVRGGSDVSVTNNGPSGGATAVDTISINTSAAIINWDTFDRTTNTTIDFLPQNTVANFTGQTDYVVLNRIFAATDTQAISLNGTVNATNFSGQRNGSVWFYSPGGILVGANAAFNVGSLVLTANDIDTTGGLFAADGTIRFRGAPSGSAVTISQGAQINLSAAGSYLAVVAPQVNMLGTATVNGPVAYVGAEQADLRINAGQFDIALLTGTDVANALTHSGTTTGPASANGSIALAVLPKNTAITMLVSGTLGYTPAATASVQNGTVILSAGYDIANGAIQPRSGGSSLSSIDIGNTAFTSSVFASARNRLNASPTGPGTLSFSSNAVLSGASAIVGADSGETLTVGGDLLVSSIVNQGITRLYSTATTGSALAAPSVTINGTTTLGKIATTGASESGQPVTGDFTQVTATGGSFNFGALNIVADTVGGEGAADGGDGTGGTARIDIGAGASLTVGDLTLSANATGGAGLTGNGGLGRAGTTRINLTNGGTATINGNLAMTADATGGVGGTFGGDADAGQLGGNQVTVGLGSSITIQGNVDMNSRAIGADNPRNARFGANALAGFSGIENRGTFSAGGSVTLRGTATGGTGFGTADGGNAGGSSGGSGGASLVSDNSFQAQSVLMDASATGGDSGKSGGTGGYGQAYNPILIAGGGSFRLGNISTPGGLSMQNDGTGGNGFVRGGFGRGAANTATFNNGVNALVGDIFMSSSGQGGSGQGTAADGGQGIGGGVNLIVGLAGDSTVADLGGVTIIANGFGGDASGTATGGIGGGGSAVAILFSGNTTMRQLDTTASGFGGSGATGGNGFGGPFSGLAMSPGAFLSIVNGVNIGAQGNGGSGFEVAAGDGRGGGALFTLDGAQFDANDIAISALGIGGYGIGGLDGTSGGSATGGTVDFTISNSTATLPGDLRIDASGYSGSSNNGNTDVSGTGGTVNFAITSGSDLSADRVQIRATGLSVSEFSETSPGSGDGASSTGGTITAEITDSDFTSNTTFVLSTAARGAYAFGISGGPSPTAGSGTGGNTTLTIGDSAFVQVGDLTILANGLGGLGLEGDAESTTPSTAGGDGIGGTATLNFNGGELTTNSVTIDAGGIGGNNRGGISTDGANAGAGTGGAANFTAASGTFLDTTSVSVLSTGVGGVADSATNGEFISPDTFRGGNGGKGTGGTATLVFSADHDLQPTLLVDASATGGTGADADANDPLATGKTGGAGGDAVAGTASLTLGGTSGDYSDITVQSDAFGGRSGFGEIGQRGGDATGGRSELIIDNVTLNVGDITLTSTANAGSARPGTRGAGPRGGDATGGATYFEIGGTDGSFTGDGFITMDATASATSGLDGATGPTGSNGGRGGNALGGSATLVATGGLLDLSNLEGFDLRVDATGGNAGNGGNATTYQPTGGGRSGDVGMGQGGLILFSAKGGTLRADSLSVSANGTAGQYGTGGFDTGLPATMPPPPAPATPAIPATYGGYGLFNYGQGGTVSVVAETNTVTGLDGTIDIGSFDATARGQTGGFGDYGYGGTASVINLNFDASPLKIGSLAINVGQPDTFYSGLVTLGATNGAIQVANNVSIFSSGDVNLESANGHAIEVGGSVTIVAGGALYGFQNDFGIPGATPGLTARGFSADAQYGIGLGTLAMDIRDTIRLGSTFGAINVGDLTAGDDIDITSRFGVTSGKLTTTGLGNDAGEDGSNVVVNSDPQAGAIALGDIDSAGYVELRGASITAGNVTAANDAILSTFNGDLTVGNVTAGDDVWLSVFGSTADSELVAPEPITSNDSTTQYLLTAGTITSTGLGDDGATSGAFTFGNAGPTGNIVRVRSTGSVNIGDVTTPDTLIVISDHDAVTTGALNATTGIAVAAQSGVTLGNVTSDGQVRIENSNQVPIIFPSYSVGGTFNGNSTSTGPGFGQPGIYGLVTLNDVDAQGLRIFAEAVDYGNIRLTRGLAIDVRYADDSFDPGNTLDGHIRGGSITAGIDADTIVGLDAIGDITFTNISTGGFLQLDSRGPIAAITGDAISAGYFLLYTSGDFNVGTVIGNAAPTFNWLNGLGAGGRVRVGELQSSFPFAVGGSDVYLRSTASLLDGSISASTGNIDVSAAGDLRLNSVQAPGTVFLRSADGDISLFDLGTGQFGVIPTDATIRADSGSIRIQNARVSNNITVDARSFISLDNFIRGRSIVLRSADIGVGGETRVGDLEETDSVEFVNTGGGTTYVGGTGTEAPGYHLDNSELQKVAADNISAGVEPPNEARAGQSPLSLTPGVPADLVLDTVTLQGGVNLGNGTFAVVTPGKMQVVGAVTLTGLNETNSVDLRAGSSIEVTPAGSLSLRGANGLTGTLNMTSEDIIASTASALTSVANAADLKARSDILGGNDAAAAGQPVVRTVFEAGGIVATVGKGLYIQNSGATTTPGNSDFIGRRGFVTGTGGFTIVQQQSNPISIAINGQQIRAGVTGTPTTTDFINGGDVIPEVKFVRFDDSTVFSASTLPNAAEVFDPLSTINGCAITLGAACQSVTPPPEPPVIPDVDDARDPIRNDFGLVPLGNDQPFVLITLKDFLPPIDQPLIDEPVTGAGNDDLWSVDDESKCDPTTTTCG